MKSYEIWEELGRTYQTAGLLSKAVDAYLKAIDQDSQSGSTFSDLAAAYVQQGKLFEAIPLYQKSLECYTCPKDQAAIWGKLGNVYRKLNENGKAIQAYQKEEEYEQLQILDTNSDFVKESKKSENEDENKKEEFTSPLSANQGWRGLIELENKITDDEKISQVEHNSSLPVASDPDDDLIKVSFGIEKNANVWNELGLVLFKVGSYDDAIDAFQKAIELEPGFGFFYSNLGQVYIAQGRLELAIDFFEKSISLFTSNKDKANSWSRLGDIYRQQGKINEMNASFQLAEALNRGVIVATSEYCQVNLDLILPNDRKARHQADIDDLKVSIQMFGIIQPLLVCPSKKEPGKYLLISGRRRFEAARQIGLKNVPVIIRPANELEIIELSINENIHTSPINPFELANSYRQLANDFDLSVEDISARVGRSVLSVANTMKVLERSGDTKQSIVPLENDSMKGEIEETGHIQEDPVFLEPSEKINRFPVFVSSDLVQKDQANVSSENNEEDQAPILWYLRPDEKEYVLPSIDRNEYPENSSLMTRARQMLKSNPHSKRIWASPAYLEK